MILVLRAFSIVKRVSACDKTERQGLKFPFFPGGKFLPPHIFLGGKLANRGGK